MATGIKGTVDWIGYPAGAPPALARGFRGTVDWVGYPAGKPSASVTGGFRGPLDFVGFSAGVAGGAEPPASGAHIKRLLLGVG